MLATGSQGLSLVTLSYAFTAWARIYAQVGSVGPSSRKPLPGKEEPLLSLHGWETILNDCRLVAEDSAGASNTHLPAGQFVTHSSPRQILTFVHVKLCFIWSQTEQYAVSESWNSEE